MSIEKQIRVMFWCEIPKQEKTEVKNGEEKQEQC